LKRGGFQEYRHNWAVTSNNRYPVVFGWVNRKFRKKAKSLIAARRARKVTPESKGGGRTGPGFLRREGGPKGTKGSTAGRWGRGGKRVSTAKSAPASGQGGGERRGGWEKPGRGGGDKGGTSGVRRGVGRFWETETVMAEKKKRQKETGRGKGGGGKKKWVCGNVLIGENPMRLKGLERGPMK